MADWDYKVGTGTITTATNSVTVTGTSTQFSNNYLNATLYDDGNVALGVVSTIVNSTSLALTTNALFAVTGNTHNYGLNYKLINLTNPNVSANVSHINLDAGLYDIKKQVHYLQFEAGSSNNNTFTTPQEILFPKVLLSQSIIIHLRMLAAFRLFLVRVTGMKQILSILPQMLITSALHHTRLILKVVTMSDHFRRR
jgi:hypothetical protein